VSKSDKSRVSDNRDTEIPREVQTMFEWTDNHFTDIHYLL